MRAVVDDVVSRVVAAMMPGSNNNEVMVSVPDAATRLGLGTTTLKELIAAGEIQSVKVGARRLVPVRALEAFSTGQVCARKVMAESSRVYPADAAKRTRSP